MAENNAESMLIAEIRGLRTDLKSSTDMLAGEFHAATDKLSTELGARIDANGEHLESIDGRLQVVEESMAWFRQQTLALSRQVADAVAGRSRLETNVDQLRDLVSAMGERLATLEGKGP